MKHSKLLYILTAIVLLANFTSCSSDDNEKDIQFYVKSKEVIYVKTTPFGEALVEVRNAASGSYTVQSNDEEIATAEINENSLISIKGKKEGNTFITVTDNSKRSATLEIYVADKTAWINIDECITKVEAENPTTEDQTEIDKIKAEMLSKVHPSGGIFRLVYTSDLEGNFSFYPDPKVVTDKIEGTFKYSWGGSLNSSSILFKSNNKEITYRLQTKDTKSVNIVQTMYLVHDFTADYSQVTTPRILKAEAALLTRGVGYFGIVTE